VGIRALLVDCVYRICSALQLYSTTAVASCGLFDRYMSCPNSVRDIPYGMPIVMVCCLDLMGKTVDADNTPCGHRHTMPLYYHYVYHRVEQRSVANKETFASDFYAAQNRVLTAVDSDLMAPAPSEYLRECSSWFSGSDATASAAGSVRRARDAENSDDACFLCDALVHDYSCSFYTSKEIAAVVSYLVAEANRIANRADADEQSTRRLRILWSAIPWVRAKELCKIAKSQLATVFGTSEGMRRMHVLRYARSLTASI
jgi:hypothetical protein